MFCDCQKFRLSEGGVLCYPTRIQRKDKKMQTPEEFLEANGLETRTVDRAGLVAAFQKEMAFRSFLIVKTVELFQASPFQTMTSD